MKIHILEYLKHINYKKLIDVNLEELKNVNYFYWCFLTFLKFKF